jgi:iron uptake system EfeUOB component EfeO/EfeM
VTHEEITAIKNEVIAECKNIFVQIEDCNEKQEQVNSKFANDDKRIDLMANDIKQMRSETKSGLKFNNWLTAAVLGCIIVGIVTFLYFNFGG